MAAQTVCAPPVFSTPFNLSLLFWYHIFRHSTLWTEWDGVTLLVSYLK